MSHAVTESQAVSRPREDEPGFDLVVADASWSWTERLFSPLADLGVRVLLIKACDWRTALNQRRPVRDWLCPLKRDGERLWQRQFVLPPGWMKTYPRLGMRPIAWAAREWHRSLDQPRPLALAISYPHYLYLRDVLRPASLLYYNMDDYAFYWTSRRESIRKLERRAVKESDLSVFCAKIRAQELADAVPEARDRIMHLPHGSPSAAISSSPQHRPASPPDAIADLPRPLLGFVGTLEDRLDWDLVSDVARAFPDGSVILIGREPEPAAEQSWYEKYRNAISLPNVHRLGWKSQAEIMRYNAAFDVCLIPYQIDHPFNRVACPTKVMDYMATSRPVVSTALPECRLYDHLFAIAESSEEFLASIRSIVDRGSDDGRAALRWQVARDSTWELTSARLLQQFRDHTQDRLP
ncbi:MAG: hypothetical protein JWN86_116 [Planctomycetota bacterium]|nr:hypothetical protein [Planctomycetota bacterium]